MFKQSATSIHTLTHPTTQHTYRHCAFTLCTYKEKK